MTDEAPPGVQVHESGRWYHTNCGGEVLLTQLQDRWTREAECEKCAARWVRGPWKLARAGKLTWDLPPLERKR